MRINKPQASLFELYRRFRTSPPRYADFFRAAWLKYLLHAVAVVAPAIAIAFAAGWPSITAFAVGLVVGVALNDESGFRQLLQLWPAIEAVLDWNKIDQLLEERSNRLRQAKSAPEPNPDRETPTG
jgi:hypothetical protein